MADNFLVVDDMMARAERLRDAIDHLESSATTAPRLTHVGSTARLVRLTAETLASFDHILVDFHLGGELHETISPVMPMLCAGATRQVTMQTGIGVMLWLRTVRDSPAYRTARGSRRPAQIYGFTNPNDGPRFRLFVAAALDWFGAIPFQPAEELDVLADYLKDPSLIEDDPLVEECQEMLGPFRVLIDLVATDERTRPGSWRYLTETVEWMEVVRRGYLAGGTTHDFELALHRYGPQRPESRQWSSTTWQAHVTDLWNGLSTFVERVGGPSGHKWSSLQAALETTSSFWSSPDVAPALLDHRYRSRR